MSPSVAHKSPTRGHSSRRSVSPERNRSEPRRRGRSPAVSSPLSRSPSRRERSPAHHKSSHRDRDSFPVRERHSGRAKSPKREKSSSPKSRSPSPRTKRLRRAQVETGKALDKEGENKYGKGSDKSRERDYKERDFERDHKERDSERDHKERDSKRDHKERDSERDHKERDRERDHSERDPEREISNDRRERKSEKDRERGKEKGRVRDGADGGSSRSRHRQSDSLSDHLRHHNQHQSRSPPPDSRSRVRDEDEDSRGAERRDDADDSLAKMEATEQALTTKEKQKPSFELSGKLAEETNRVRGVNLLFTEPPDARKPNIRWRLYVFKGGEVLNEPLYVHRQTCYLFGRERRVADIPTDHPSCSKQHAVLQYRQVEKEQPDGMMSKQVRPYLMDLGSTNKTFINDNPIEAQRYYELFEKDTIRFGNSSREYVLLHENSST